MKCTIYFKIGKEEHSLEVESPEGASSVYEEAANILRANEELRDKVVRSLKQRLNTITSLKVNISQLLKEEGLVGNASVYTLKQLYPDVHFPNNYDADILLIKNLIIGGKKINGRRLTSNGKELYIISDSKNDVESLAQFLTIKLQLEEGAFTFSEDSELYQLLNVILEEKNKHLKKNKLNSINDLILNFLDDSSSYIKLYITDSNGKQQSAFKILTDIKYDIYSYSAKIQYDDDVVNEINYFAKYRGNGVKTLDLDILYNTLNTYKKDLLNKLNITSKDEFKNFFKDPDITKFKEIFTKFDEEKESVIQHFITDLLATEPEFNLVFNKLSENTIYFKSIAKSIEYKYGYTYDLIAAMEIVDNNGKDNYLGYKIYKTLRDGKEVYYVANKSFLTEKHFSKEFKSLEDAKAAIEQYNQKAKIGKLSMIELKFKDKTDTGYSQESLNRVTLTSNLIEHATIESIDVSIDKNVKLMTNEQKVFDSGTLEDFVKLVNSWNISDNTKANIISKINTTEKAGIFLYKITEELRGARNNDEIMLKIVDTIENAGVVYYFVESKTINNNGTFSYSIIKVNPDQIDEVKINKTYPMMLLMSAIKENFFDKFGMVVHLVNAEDVAKMENVNQDAKAFIYNGEVYVNTSIGKTTDLLHEYIHLLLGVIKTNPELRSNYEQLLYAVVSTKQGLKLLEKVLINYPEISKIDAFEEVFAREFSYYIMNHMNQSKDIITLFNESEGFFKDVAISIFGTKINDTKKFYQNSIDVIFKRFSNDVAKLLRDSDKLSFANTKTGRLISNWINQKIEEKEIKEDCK